MASVAFVTTDVPPWTAEHPGALAALDTAMVGAGASPVTLPPDAWSGVLPDGDHFHQAGEAAFIQAFANALHSVAGGGHSRVLVLTDSTIGHGDYRDESGEWTGDASRRLAELLCAKGIGESVTVDAVCGSGFMAGGPGEHFRVRLSSMLRIGPVSLVVFCGGWNDVRDECIGLPALSSAAVACVALAMRGCRACRRGAPHASPPTTHCRPVTCSLAELTKRA